VATAQYVGELGTSSSTKARTSRAYQNPDTTGSFTATGQWLAIIVAFW
jgi:hypothetical protein